jgi:hypothetical protein
VGSRTAVKLKEIEVLRASLGRKLEEVERRVPAAGFGKKIAAGVAGSSVAGTALTFLFKRLRGGRKKKKAEKQAAKAPPVVAPSNVTVNVFPKGAVWLAAAGLAGYAAFKIYNSTKQKDRGLELARPPQPVR